MIATSTAERSRTTLRHLVGSGHKIGLFALPFVLAGLALWAGFLLNALAGALIGIGLYLGSRKFAPEEEAELSKTFGAAWDTYCHTVKVPWL